METIIICSNHQHYKVPLIWTFAFPGAEYWCPYCGYISGMLGAGDEVESTQTLRNRRSLYVKKTKKYLKAHAVLCSYKIKYKGKWIKPSELPESTKKRHSKIRESYKYEQRV